MNDSNNATTCNIIQALIYRKYQRRIHHACITLHTPRYLSHLNKTNHQCKLPMSKSLSNVNQVLCKQNVMYGK